VSPFLQLEHTYNIVDIQATTDSGGGYNLGWVKATEWVKYSVTVAATGTYAVDVRVRLERRGRHVSSRGRRRQRDRPDHRSDNRRLASVEDDHQDRRRAFSRSAHRARRDGRERRDWIDRELQLVRDSMNGGVRSVWWAPHPL
jgi:hypothetical protein